MKIKTIILMFLAAIIILSGCSGSEAAEADERLNASYIQLQSSCQALSSDLVPTRTPYMGSISEKNPLEARVLSATTSKDYAGSLYTSGKMTFMGGASVSAYNASTVDASKMKFPTNDNTPIYLFGLYPYQGWDNPGATSIDFNFIGKEDVMAAAEKSTSYTNVKASNYASLTFKHLLTKIEVSLKAESSAAIAVWEDVTKIELIKAVNAYLPNKVNVPFDDTTEPTFSGNSAGTPFPFYTMSSNGDTSTYTTEEFKALSIGLTTKETPVAYSMIAPFTATGTSTDLTFMVYTVGRPEGTEVNVPLHGLDGLTPFTGSTTGRAFNIVFTFRAQEGTIAGASSVTEWVFSGKTEIGIE